MALVSATITVTFTSDYSGCHRVCYRTGSGGYTCTNVTCAGGGASCSVPITITVDNETCPTVFFDGYAQACCQDVSSLTGRIPFSTSFVPSPACKRYLATCTSAPLASIAVTGAGSGYMVPSNPSVSFSGGGGGSGAAATANVGTGFITTTNITFIGGGSGYTPGTYTNVDIQGGSGTGAKGTFTVSGAGVVVSGIVTSHGNGYQNSDMLKPAAAAMGGNLTDATFNVVTDYGTVISVTLNNTGLGYTTSPTITIAPPPAGTIATASAVLSTCSNFSVNSCSGTGNPSAGLLQPGQSVDFCTVGAPPAPSDYTITQDTGNCLCTCQSVTLAATSGAIDSTVAFRYTACNGAITTISLHPGGSPSSVTVCAVTGSIIMSTSGGAIGTITYHGAC